MYGQHLSQRLVEFLTAVSGHRDEDAATLAAAELAAEYCNAEVGAVVVDGALRAVTGLGAIAPPPELGGAGDGSNLITLPGLGPCHLAQSGWQGDRPGALLVARAGEELADHERQLLMGMARVLGLTLHGIAALATERTLRAERERQAEERLSLLDSLK